MAEINLFKCAGREIRVTSSLIWNSFHLYQI